MTDLIKIMAEGTRKTLALHITDKGIMATNDFRNLEPQRTNYPITAKGNIAWEKDWKQWWNKYLKPIFD